MRRALGTRGFIVSIAGPSKSGKTVLCERVIGPEKMMLIPGGGIGAEPEFWRRVRSKLRTPIISSTSTTAVTGQEASLTGKASFGVKFIANASSELGGKLSMGRQTQQSLSFETPNGLELLNEASKQGLTVVVDDFHYIPKDVQRSLIQQFKEASRGGCSIVVVSVSHRVDDAIRANPDIRGRLACIDVPYWTEEELIEIPRRGFKLLMIKLPDDQLEHLAEESVSSPQLMQALCSTFCALMGVEESLREITDVRLTKEGESILFRDTTQIANCQTAIDILGQGPKSRGNRRLTYNPIDGYNGDVYYIVFRAIASGQPKLTLKYDEIRARIAAMFDAHDGAPDGGSVIRSLEHMDKASRSLSSGQDRILEWDKEKLTLTIVDPYFLYFLRWKAWT